MPTGKSAGLEQVGQEIVKVLRSTGMTTDQVNASFATTVDTLVALKTQFGVNIPEVTTLAKYWSSYAAAVGFSTEQIWAWSAALVSVGARAQGAGGALTKILEKASEAAADGGKDWANWAQVVGQVLRRGQGTAQQRPEHLPDGLCHWHVQQQQGRRRYEHDAGRPAPQDRPGGPHCLRDGRRAAQHDPRSGSRSGWCA